MEKILMKINENLDYQYIIDRCNTLGSIYGEFDVPEEAGISLKNISHVIKDLRIEYGYLIGDITILNTEKGRFLKDLIDNEIDISFQPRTNSSKIFTFDASPYPYNDYGLMLRDLKIKRIMKKI